MFADADSKLKVLILAPAPCYHHSSSDPFSYWCRRRPVDAWMVDCNCLQHRVHVLVGKWGGVMMCMQLACLLEADRASLCAVNEQDKQ